MELFEGVVAAGNAIRRFFYQNEDDLPAFVRERLEQRINSGASDVDLSVAFVELVYANRAGIPAEGLAIAAAASELIYQSGFTHMPDDRARSLVPVLRRESGEAAPGGAPWPVADDDPAPNRAFLEPEDLPMPPLPETDE